LLSETAVKNLNHCLTTVSTRH